MNYRKVFDKKTQNEDFKTLLNNTDQRFKTLGGAKWMHEILE